MRVEFYKHNINEEDITRCIEVLRTPWLTTGKVVEELEEALSKYLEVDYVVCVSSCTAALHLSLVALGIGLGCEVITTPLTFAATSNSVLYTGARLKFADVNTRTGLIDLECIKRALTPSTKAILPVHLYGNMLDMDSLLKLANEDLNVIEDSAHCLEGKTTPGGYSPGHYGDTACFSFYPIKSITSGEGGAIATDNKRLADKLRMLRNQGMTKSASDRYTKLYQHWDIEDLGYNYRTTNFQAALLLGQLGRVEKLRRQRVEIDLRYREAFEDSPRIGLLERDEESACLMFTVLVENRDTVLHKLQEKDIGVAVNYRPVHFLSYYRKNFGYKEGDFPNSEYIGSRTITLPLYPQLTELEQEYVIQNVLEVVNGTT